MPRNSRHRSIPAKTRNRPKYGHRRFLNPKHNSGNLQPNFTHLPHPLSNSIPLRSLHSLSRLPTVNPVCKLGGHLRCLTTFQRRWLNVAIDHGTLRKPARRSFPLHASQGIMEWIRRAACGQTPIRSFGAANVPDCRENNDLLRINRFRCSVSPPRAANFATNL